MKRVHLVCNESQCMKRQASSKSRSSFEIRDTCLWIGRKSNSLQKLQHPQYWVLYLCAICISSYLNNYFSFNHCVIVSTLKYLINILEKLAIFLTGFHSRNSHWELSRNSWGIPMPSAKFQPIWKIRKENLPIIIKGQLISKGLFDVIVSTKKPTEFFWEFLL